jgi:hypothetical protein
MSLFAGAAVSDSSRSVIPNQLFLSIEKKVLAWEDGLFGSMNFCAADLDRFLDSSRGAIVVSPYSFILVSPYDTGSAGFACTFEYESWLVISGYVPREQVARIRALSLKEREGWWRSASLVSISGKIRKFRLDSSPDRKRLILFLDGIEFAAPLQDRSKQSK